MTDIANNPPFVHPRIALPLVVKLIGIVSTIVLVSMTLVSVLSWWLYSADAETRAEENNFGVGEVLAAQVSAEISGVNARVLTLLDNVQPLGLASPRAQAIENGFFSRNATIATIAIPHVSTLNNTKFYVANGLDTRLVAGFLASQTAALAQAAAGDSLVLNASPAFGVSTAALLVPYRDSGTPNALVVLFSSESLQTIVQTKSANLSFVVDYQGRVIAHPDATLVKIAASLKDAPVVADLLKSPSDNLQKRYVDVDPETKNPVTSIGAFHKISFGHLGVASTIAADTVYAAALRITRQNAYLTGIVLLFSILAVWLFARSVTRPVLRLVDASRLIESGQFELDLKATTKDELGLLTKSFVSMGRGLGERERVKETFGKFVNKEIAELALKGDLKLGGTRRVATIFFSDIRSFTAISETLEPEAVVEFLNLYMTRMVACINQTHGVVDKFIGDAIMGVWGAPVSQGSPAADALLAVRAMLLMRESLMELNADRGGPGKPVIKIGCGLNTGPCLAGQIGSDHKMEYTVIGDAVNLASRIEALNKPFGTDVLISQSTFELVGDQFLTQPMAPIKVKGKAQALQIYAVINEQGRAGPVTLEELRELLNIPTPQANVDPDQEENKYEILSG